MAIRYDGSSPVKDHGFQLHVGPMNTDVKGHVKIKSSNPMHAPAIHFNYLSTKQERKEWCEAVRCARKLIETKAMNDFKGEEISPGKSVETDAEILNFVAEQGRALTIPVVLAKWDMIHSPLLIMN